MRQTSVNTEAQGFAELHAGEHIPNACGTLSTLEPLCFSGHPIMVDTDGGWVRLYRKAFDSQVFQSAPLWQLWCYCLGEAAWKERWTSVSVGKATTEVHLLPGQCVFGRHAWAKYLRQKPTSTWERLLKLRNMGNIDIQTDSHYSIVTVCKWSTYQINPNENGQATRQPSDSRPTGNRQPSDTLQEGKEGKEVQEGVQRPSPQEVIHNLEQQQPSLLDIPYLMTLLRKHLNASAFTMGMQAKWMEVLYALRDEGCTTAQIKGLIPRLSKNAAHWDLTKLVHPPERSMGAKKPEDYDPPYLHSHVEKVVLTEEEQVKADVERRRVCKEVLARLNKVGTIPNAKPNKEGV